MENEPITKRFLFHLLLFITLLDVYLNYIPTTKWGYINISFFHREFFYMVVGVILITIIFTFMTLNNYHKSVFLLTLIVLFILIFIIGKDLTTVYIGIIGVFFPSILTWLVVNTIKEGKNG